MDQNLTNQMVSNNTTSTLNLTPPGSINNLTTTPLENLTPSEKSVGAETTAKPVYKQSIGSVYPADYKEPEARTFTSSSC